MASSLESQAEEDEKKKKWNIPLQAPTNHGTQIVQAKITIQREIRALHSQKQRC